MRVYTREINYRVANNSISKGARRYFKKMDWVGYINQYMKYKAFILTQTFESRILEIMRKHNFSWKVAHPESQIFRQYLIPFIKIVHRIIIDSLLPYFWVKRGRYEDLWSSDGISHD